MRLTWAFFPYAVALGLAGVAVVDGGMIWTAIRTFPGRVTHSQFEDSNRYDAVRENAALEAALGWNTELTVKGRRSRARGLSDRRADHSATPPRSNWCSARRFRASMLPKLGCPMQVSGKSI